MSTSHRGRRLRRPVGLAVAIMTAMVPTIALAGGPAPAGHDRSPAAAAIDRLAADGPTRVIVQVAAQHHAPALASEVRHSGARNVRTFEHLPFIVMSTDGAGIARLANNPRVVAVQKDEAVPPALDASLPLINADDVQALGWTGAGQTVAVLDTGIDSDHPFFDDNNGLGGSRILAEACFSDPNNVGGDGQISLCPNGTQTDTSADVDGHAQCTAAVNNCDHGTHVAGIAAGDGTGLAAAPASGVAPDANLVIVQVFTRHNQAADCAPNAAPCLLAFVSDQIAGLNQVLAWDAANPGWNIASANMSLGGGNNAAACDGDARKAAIDALLAAGIATTIAAGNNGFLNAVGAPACISTAVSVGNSTLTDAVWTSSNRGPLLDIFAPGRSIVSSIVDDVYGTKTGTSMAAPHVAGAFAVLREAYPARTIANLLNDMQTTGVPITYATAADGSTSSTTPRLNLLASLQAPNDPPFVSADVGTVTVDEGMIAVNTGTYFDPEGDPVTLSASSGTLVDNNDGTWSWTLQTADGPDDSQIVTVVATDDKDESTSTTFELVVDNVAPTVTITALNDADESGLVTVEATFSDPGYLDTYSVAIDWGTTDGDPVGAVSVVIAEGGPGPDVGQIEATYQYGDNGDYTVTVTVTDDDGGQGSDADVSAISNLDPDLVLDTTGTVLLGGEPTIIASIGETVDVGGAATDPGSDDLIFEWDWDDGTSDSLVSLVNPPAPDPAMSPTNQPRNASVQAGHEFGGACVFDVGLTVTDDDGGLDVDSIKVIIVGLADDARSAGYWSSEYRDKRRSDFDAATKLCMLDIARHASTVFDELRPLSTFADAVDVLKTNGSSDADELFDAQLLAAWLNFANGAYGWDELVDTDGDGVPDTAYGAVLQAAELLRTGPHSNAEILAAKALLESLNVADA